MGPAADADELVAGRREPRSLYSRRGARPTSVSGMPVLSPAQLESFLERGFCILENAFDRQLAEDTVRRAYTRMGFTPHEPASWANFDQCLLHSISRCILPLSVQSSDHQWPEISAGGAGTATRRSSAQRPPAAGSRDGRTCRRSRAGECVTPPRGRRRPWRCTALISPHSSYTSSELTSPRGAGAPWPRALCGALLFRRIRGERLLSSALATAEPSTRVVRGAAASGSTRARARVFVCVAAWAQLVSISFLPALLHRHKDGDWYTQFLDGPEQGL